MDDLHIPEILESRYGICCYKINLDKWGSGRNYWINDNYLLKIFDCNVKYRIEDEISICQYLSSKDFATSRHIASIDGLYIQKIGNYRMHLQYKLPGMVKEKNSLVLEQGDAFIGVLKNIVELLMDYSIEVKPNMLFANEYVMSDIINTVYGRLNDADFALREIIKRKIELLNRIQFDNGKVYGSIISHSDYNIQQLLFDRNTKSSSDITVIDFSHVSRIPIEWEIIKACLKSMEFRKSDCIMTIINAFTTFEKYVPISYNNVSISIIQLVSSAYMEKMYLRTNQRKWLTNINYELDVLEELYYSMR